MSPSPINLTLLLYVLALISAFALRRQDAQIIRLACGLFVLGSLADLLIALPALQGSAVEDLQLWLLDSAHIDALAALFLLAISLVGLVACAEPNQGEL